MKLSTSIVCTHVLHGSRPILQIWKEEDGDTTLTCGRGDHAGSLDDWAVAHTFHVTAQDPALGVVHVLKRGEEAERTHVGAPWRRSVSPPAA